MFYSSTVSFTANCITVYNYSEPPRTQGNPVKNPGIEDNVV